MTYIRAPFNFVPLNEHVFFPDWAEQISQDIPFSDGLSGTIDLTITAESPIFIRNGHGKEDEPDKKTGKFRGDTEEERKRHERIYNSFSCVMNKDGFPVKDENGQPLYFIPGTSIKGEVRTLLEIMSFGKMTVDERAKFAKQRDLNNGSEYLGEIKEDIKKNTILCGWLQRKANSDDFEIINCEKPYRISQKDIDTYLNSEFSCGSILEDNFSESSSFEPKKKVSGKDYLKSDVYYKLNLLQKYRESMKDIRFSLKKDQPKEPYIPKNRVEVNKGSGSIKGTIVVTGQPYTWEKIRKPRSGKFYEFVFEEEKQGAPTYTITKKEFDKYRFIYEHSHLMEDFIKSKNGTRRLPVFFRVSGSKLKDWGLAYLYRIPYGKSVAESLYQHYPAHKDPRPDLAQCIFGFTDVEKIHFKKTDGSYDKEKHSLKGRIQFGNAMATSAQKANPVKLVLSSPKASYYPIYVEQKDGKNGYSTYDDSNPKGWKRYHVRKKQYEREADTNREGVDSQNTTIYPLKNAVFECAISFHNIKPEETGALLAALTFFDNAENCFHQLGQAKPYGYGLCRYRIKSMTIFTLSRPTPIPVDVQGQKDYMKAFEKAMNKDLGAGKKWITQEQIKQLFTNSSRLVDSLPNYFMYMTLDEYLDAKQKGYSLPLSTQRGLEEYKPESIVKTPQGTDPLPIPEEPNFGDWIKAIKACAEKGKENLTEEEKEFAFSKLKEAFDAKPESTVNYWKPNGVYCKRASKLKLIGKDLANEWFSRLSRN